VIQTFFDKGWIEARNNEDGSITWRTTAGKSGTFLYEGVQSIPVWQQILESIFEHWLTDGKSARGIDFQHSIGIAPRDCKEGAHHCRAHKIQGMLELIHQDIKVEAKLCTLSTNSKDFDMCLTEAESPTTCIAFSVDKKVDGRSTSHALAVRQIRRERKEKLPRRKYLTWELDVYNQQTHCHGTYICDREKWTPHSPKKCTSANNPKNHFSDVFRYTISGLPVVHVTHHDESELDLPCYPD